MIKPLLTLEEMFDLGFEFEIQPGEFYPLTISAKKDSPANDMYGKQHAELKTWLLSQDTHRWILSQLVCPIAFEQKSDIEKLTPLPMPFIQQTKLIYKQSDLFD